MHDGVCVTLLRPIQVAVHDAALSYVTNIGLIPLLVYYTGGVHDADARPVDVPTPLLLRDIPPGGYGSNGRGGGSGHLGGYGQLHNAHRLCRDQL